MKSSVIRLFRFNFNHYEIIEEKLEEYALKGLFLEKIGTTFWYFKKDTPKKLHYTVTYFTEASYFNPTTTVNQNTYHEIAKQAGWNFVCELHQMQVFCSDQDNPVPFETDEIEKLTNIHKCMKKNFLPTHFMLVIVLSFNLFTLVHNVFENPTYALASNMSLLNLLLYFLMLPYLFYILISYYSWYIKSKKAVNRGDGILKVDYSLFKYVDRFTIGFVGIFLLVMILVNEWYFLFMIITPLIVIAIIHHLTVFTMKKAQIAAKVTRKITFVSTIVLTILFYSIFTYLLLTYFHQVDKVDTVRVEDSEVGEYYHLYNHALPLKCEDLYNEYDYDGYSYKMEENSSILMQSIMYTQHHYDYLKETPSLTYHVFTFNTQLIYPLVVDDLLEDGKYSHYEVVHFDALNANAIYQKYREDKPLNDYVLLYDSQIIVLNLYESLDNDVAATIYTKLINP